MEREVVALFCVRLNSNSLKLFLGKLHLALGLRGVLGRRHWMQSMGEYKVVAVIAELRLLNLDLLRCRVHKLLWVNIHFCGLLLDSFLARGHWLWLRLEEIPLDA
jgi:hypothetical protein